MFEGPTYKNEERERGTTEEIKKADENLQECQLLKTIGAIEEETYNSNVK